MQINAINFDNCALIFKLSIISFAALTINKLMAMTLVCQGLGGDAR
jgi:hypothetical protein